MKQSPTKPKIIVIVGPTASGKSDLAVELALAYNGEVISADSRQVYKGLDIGTGKITDIEMRGVPHYLLDVASPKRMFTASDFKTKAERALKTIVSHGKTPIICGGTGFYIQAFVDGLEFPEVKPNAALRKKLSLLSAQDLFSHLKEIDPTRAETIDAKNPHRLIRAIEITTALGKVPSISRTSNYNPHFIGISTDDAKLKQQILERLNKRIDQGMVEEALRLHAEGLSWKRMESLGLEYKFLAYYLTKKITREQLIEQLSLEIWHYAKRQKTWFKKDQRISWFTIGQKDQIKKSIATFLHS